MSTPELRAYNRAKALRYRLRHPERKRRSSREWNRRNIEKVRAKAKLWRQGNPGYQGDYFKRKCLAQPSYRIAHDLRTRLWEILTKNKRKVRSLWEQRFGCTLSALRSWIQLGWQPGMSWENYGVDGWEIDHIKPCCDFDLSDEAQVQACFHHTNLRPLWGAENRTKNRRPLSEL